MACTVGDMTQRLSTSAIVYLVIPPMLWAGNAVVGRLMNGLVPPITLNLLRWVLALLILLPLAGQWLKPGSGLWPHWRRFTWLGLLGVVIFALTLPLTRLAVGTPQAPQLSGLFVASGRATVAAVLSILFLRLTRAPIPRRSDWPALGLVTLGVVFGFPMLSSIAMRHVEAVHASVMLGVLPLAVALRLRKRRLAQADATPQF